MVRSRQSQGWHVAALLLCITLFGGCEEFEALSGGQDDPAAGGQDTAPSIESEATVQFSVYIDGEPVDTVNIPQSLLPAEADASGDGEEADEAAEAEEEPSQEDAPQGEAVDVADDAHSDETADTNETDGDETDGEVSAGSSETDAESAADEIVIPEILLERERAIAAQMELNATVDYQMDWLSYELGQDLTQLPPLNPPPPPAGQYPVNLTREEAKWQMEQAVALSQSGDLKGALDLLTPYQVDYAADYELYGAWTRMVNELAALYFDSIDVAPVAARMTATVLMSYSDSTIRVIRDDLRRDWAWAWRYEGRTRIMEELFSLTPDPDGTLPDSLMAIEGYSNVGLPGDLLSTDRPLEHYHYAVYLMDEEYLMSYSLQSRELSGTGRIYFLERRLGGDPEVLLVYPYLPDYWSMLNEVKVHLEQAEQQ